MGMNRGGWVIGNTPRERKYPIEIAAKMVHNIKSVSQDEACQMVGDAEYFYNLCNDQAAIISGLKKELAIAEQTVKLLQVEPALLGINH